MSETEAEANVKVEDERVNTTDGGEEGVNEIQNYLENFNKEIGEGNQDATAVTGQGIPEGYYVDESGQYYFHDPENGGQIMTVVQSIDPEVETIDENMSGEEYMRVEQENDQKEGIISESADGSREVLDLNSGEYQTVTILPSEGSSGDNISYVLIVQQNSGDGEEGEASEVTVVRKQQPRRKILNKGKRIVGKVKTTPDGDLKVFDFDDIDPISSSPPQDGDSEIDDKSKIVKITNRKQIVAPAHMCNYCNYTSPKRYLLARHMKSHSEERPHKCSVCERGFKTVASLTNHVNTHTGVKPHKCKYCESKFTTSGELVRHVRYKHTHEKPHKCPTCDYASVELSKMRNHMRSHTGERPYQCPHCTYASPDTFKLKRHLRIHTGEKPYACDICGARFTQSNSLKSHRLIHTGEKPVFYCDLCPATCGRKTDLRIHVQKLHTAEAPLKCKRCGQTFPDRYNYKQHCKSHEGEKCWKCDLCPYASSSQRHLESHLLIHTDQKPYSCEHCDQSFRQKQLLKRHVNLYHNPQYIPAAPKEKTHKCPECKKAFRHKGNLLRHMSLHDPESSLHEQQVALKLGRQKKVHIIDGHKVEVIPDEDDDEDEGEETDDGEMSSSMSVQGNDGHQYVVLEVIQLQNADGTEQNVAVVPADSLMTMGGKMIKTDMSEMHQESDEGLHVGEDGLVEEESGQDEVIVGRDENDSDMEEEVKLTGIEEVDEEEEVEVKNIIMEETPDDDEEDYNGEQSTFLKLEPVDEAEEEKEMEEEDSGRQTPSMDNCFGFEEDEEEDEEEEEEVVVKPAETTKMKTRSLRSAKKK